MNLKETIFFLHKRPFPCKNMGLILILLFVFTKSVLSQEAVIRQTEICTWPLPTLTDTFLCPGASLQINLDTIVGNLQRDTFRFNPLETLDGQIHKPFSPLKINLQVKDLPNEKINLKEYNLTRICLDIYTPRASDLEVWLIPPSGNIDHVLELVSPQNASNSPDLLQTCFTPGATRILSTGNPPYTGEFSIAGSWSGLMGEDLNGNWQLWVSDRVAETVPGLVQSISLVFETKPAYQIKWETKAGISCLNCKDPVFNPIITTDYPVQLINSSGCVFNDTLRIEYRDKTFGPSFTCEPKGPGKIDVSWQLPPLLVGETYTGSILQRGKAAINLATSGNQKYSFTDLLPKDSITIIFKLPLKDGVMCQPIDTIFQCVFPPCELEIIEKENIPISCFGSEDGLLVLSFSKGFTPISLTKDGEPTGSKIERLKAGIHTFVATDFLGCQTSRTVNFIEPSPIKTNISLLKPALCFDLAGAQLKAEPTGGNGGYTFRWQPDGGTSATTNPIKHGAYALTVTDAKSCVGKDSFLIESPPPIIGSIVSTPTICSGSATGTLKATVTGGVLPYRFMWNNGNTNTDITDLPAGPYSLTITDQNQCNHTVNTVIAQGASVLKIDSSQITPVSCYGNEDGLARIFVSGGSKPYQIKWSDPLAQVGNLANRLATGSYFINITDAKGCALQHQVLMTSPLPLQMNIQTRNLTCLNKNDGEIEVFPAGGIIPYQLLWSDNSTLKKRINLPAGDYAVTLTDANKCKLTDKVTINNPSNPLKISAVQTYNGCFGKKENSVQTTVTGGSPAYFIFWNTGFNGLLSSNLDTLSYTIKVNDAQGCLDSIQIKPVDLPEIKPEINIKTPSCFNDQNGEISLTKINGREGIDFSLFRYQWSSGQRTPLVTGLLGAENYTLTVTDAKGCTGISRGYMRNPSPVILTLEGTDPTCNAGKDGKIWLKSIQSEVSTSFYTWSAANQAAAKDTIFNLAAGIYQLTVTNVSGCKGSTSFNLKEPPAIIIDQFKKGNACFGYAEGEAEISITGGNPGYNILWSDGNTTFKRQNMKGGTYNISVTDARNCLKVEEVTIYQPEKTILDFDLDSVSCFRKSDAILSFVAFGGKGPFVYSFDKTTWQTGNRISSLGAGKYTLFLKDANSCLTDTTFNIPEPLFFNIDLGQEVIKANYNQKISLIPLLFNGQAPIKYQWSLPDSTALSCLRCKNAVFTANRTMEINLSATDRNGCIAKDGVKILVSQQRNIAIPTAFSPNNDAQNDILIIHGPENIKILQFKIYDQLGNLVYQDADFLTNEISRGWNGTFRQMEVPVGNYEWFCTVEYPDGYKDYLRGQTQLIR